MAIQNPSHTLSDFYCCWIRIQIRLERMKSDPGQVTDLCSSLLDDLRKRKCGLLKHPAMLCAIFLDPRVHREFELQAENETEFKIAKITLGKLNERIFNLKEDAAPQTDANDSLEQYYNENTQLESADERRTQFMESLDHFHRSLQYMKMDKEQSIFDFWKNKKLLFPALYEVACVINAIPPSQATVERSFSTLRFIFGELRTSIDQEKLENILMIKLNSDLALSINENDICEIGKKFNNVKV